MTRFKQELRKRGITLECDYEYLPYNGLETVIVDQERAAVHEYHDCLGWVSTYFDRAFREVMAK